MKPHSQIIHELFMEQAVRTPQKVAVSFEGEQVTYQELNKRSNRVAHDLLARGIVRNEPVALLVDKSVEMIVALLGILKAGAAFVPLDPTHPPERIATILEEAAPRWLLTQDAHRGKLPVPAEGAEGLSVLIVENSINSSMSSENPPVCNEPEDLTYILYTSGSTGRPKGVMGCHKSLVHFIRWEIEEFSIGEGDRVSQFAALTFDPSLRDLFVPLCAGGTVCLPRRETVLNREALVAWLMEEQITIVHCVPSLFRQVLAEVQAQTQSGREAEAFFPQLRYVFLGGEVLEVKYVRQWKDLFCTGRQLVNFYGPTEVTMVKLFHVIQELPPEGRPIPIGKAIKGAAPLILDDNQKLCGIGQIGEIYIRSPYLALGYYKNPELTQEVYLQNPLIKDKPDRVYRTGDLGRYLADGTVEYVGRRDFQVKVRGFRVELPEIEAVLTRHPAVREVAVVARTHEDGDSQLLAYLTAADEAVTMDELRRFLLQTLPEYMVPAQFHLLEQMPLNANGKIDRKHLREAGVVGRLLVDQAFVAPRTATEQQIAAIWAEVLRTESIGATDNFFARGGHSLLAMQVFARLKELTQAKVALQDLFDHVTVEALAKRVEDLVAAGETADQVRIHRLPEQESYALSHAQSRLWFLCNLDPQNTAYNVPNVMTLRGALDGAALEQAFAQVIARHAVLRSVFVELDGQPRQVVQATSAFVLERHDLTALPMAERAQRAAELVQDDVARPFDLRQGPLLRAMWVQVAEQEHQLVLNVHHIISDAWSMSVFVDELAAAYDAFRQGANVVVAPLDLQYVDVAAWQNQQLAAGALAQQEAHWLTELAKPLPILNLPLDAERPAVQTFEGATYQWSMEGALYERVRQLATDEEASLFMVLMAAYHVLLHRLSGDDDVIVGTPIAGRTSSQMEALIGFFVNTLALRTRFAGISTFRELLQQVKEKSLAAFEHQSYPFDLLIEKLNPDRDLSRSPVFSAMFILQNAPSATPRFGDLDVEIGVVAKDTSKFDITLVAAEDAVGSLQLLFEYNRNLFQPETVANFARQFEQVVAAVVADAEADLHRIDLLTARDRAAWQALNDTARPDYDVEHMVLEAFIAHAEQHPERVALIDRDRTMTYGELHRRSNRVAQYLRGHGVARNQLVAILMERSLEVIVAVYGILKAGAAYVPIDPDYPEARIAYMLADSEAPVVLTKAQHLDTLQALSGTAGAPVVALLDEDSSDWLAMASGTDEMPVLVNDPGDLAYMIYTSGSTGQPKGVKITHRSIVNRLLGTRELFAIDETDVVAQKTSICFDPSVWEMLLPMFAGATMLIIPNEILKDAWKLHQCLNEQRVTVIQLVPSMFAAVVYALEGMAPAQRPLPHLRWIAMGGEALPLKPVNLWYELLGEGAAQIANMYGPTETTIDTVWSFIAGKQEFIHIGRPTANVQAYVLDKWDNLAPVHVQGELIIGGVQVGAGYHNKPEKTAEVFIPNHLPGTPGDTLYRTGDLARLMPDGNVEYLGRIDNQVKVRGFRIELGEIEDALTDHADVEIAAVVVHKQENGNTTLVGYYTTANVALTARELRAFLGAKVPDYMVPAHLHRLDVMPLTPNGKVDRKGLAQQAALALPSVQEGMVAPSTPTEQAVAAIWSDILGLETVGVTDNFYEVGGHSLLLMQVHSRIRSTLHAGLELRDLFACPTIGELAARIDGDLAYAEVAVGLVGTEIEPAPVRAHYELSHAQKRLWFLYQFDPASTVYNIPMNLVIRHAIDRELWAQALHDLVVRHASLRTVFVEVDGAPQQVVRDDLDVQLVFADLATRTEAEQEDDLHQLVRTSDRVPFDLTNGPLVRAMLVKRGDAHYHFHLNLPHIITDGWSNGLLLDELLTIYRARVQGVEPQLPEIARTYVDYAEWQARALASTRLQQEEDYWLTVLQKPLPVLELPLDFPRPEVQTFPGDAVRHVVPQPIAAALRELAKQEETSMFTVLFAAYVKLMAQLSQQEDIVVGTTIAGRTEQALEPIVGLFVNTLAVRTQLEGLTTWQDLLDRVRGNLLDAFQHQSYPFDRLIEKIAPARDMSRTPVFSTMFEYLPGSLGLLGDEEFVVERDTETSEINTSKFDLSAFVTENEAGELEVLFNFNTDLFRKDSVARFVGTYMCVLEAFAHSTLFNQPMAAVELLTDADRALLTAMNATDVHYDLDRSLLEAFVEQAEQHPERIALLDQGRVMTYGELHERSNRLAHFLRAQGIARNQLVTIMMERSCELLVGLYGILKAGAAYVPVDPEYPTARVQYMIEDSGSSVFLTKHAYLQQIMDIAGEMTSQSLSSVVFLDEALALPAVAGVQTYGWCDVAQHPHDGISLQNDPSDLAYMIYTSGSTGQPKGVLIQHRAILNRLYWHQDTFALQPGEVAIQRTTQCFDDSVIELFWPLRHGATLSIMQKDVFTDPERLLEQLMSDRATYMQFVPSVFALFVSALQAMPEAARPTLDLRTVIVSGEALPTKLVNAWFDMYPQGAQIANLYGPTEAAVDVSCFLIREPQAFIHIGRPIANTQLYVVNRDGVRVPVGVKGELLVGGVQLAVGYHNKPEKTAEAFLPNAWPDAPGERLYRTGDLARVLPDGTIEFLGRVDNQVKIRGFRIELGEIEEALTQHPEIEMAAVIVKQGPDGNNALYGFYTTGNADLDTGAIKSFLAARLPDYMVPARLQRLDAMPLSPVGKVERKVLAQLAEEDAFVWVREHVAPTTEVERALAAVWSEVLAMADVGTTDNFFDLGGHSLLAIQVLNKTHKQLGVRLELRDLFAHPTIAELATCVEAALTAGQQQADNVIPAVADQPHYALSHAQKRLWFLWKLDPLGHAYNIPMSVVFRGTLDVDLFAQALDLLVARHESLRTVFHEVDGEPRQVVLATRSFLLERVDLRGMAPVEQKERVQQAIRAREQQPFDLASGPLLRAAIFALEAERWQFYLSLHHIITDGWSNEVFVEELFTLYRALLAGTAAELPPLPLRYVDYAEWQARELVAGSLQQAESYWLTQLQKPLPVLNLPLDQARPEIQTFDGDLVRTALPPSLVQTLREVSKREDVSMFMVGLAAYTLLLHHLTQDEDVIIGTPVAGRTTEQVEPLIGFFVNTLALRMQLGGLHDLRALLQQVKQRALDAFAHQSYPFDLLIERLNPERDTSRSPIFSTMFIYQAAHRQEQTLETLTFESAREDLEHTIAKYDLSLSFVERGEELEVGFEYNTNLFHRATVERFTANLLHVLQAFCHPLHIPLAELELATAADRALYAALNETQVPFEQQRTIQAQFEHIAAQQAERIAVSDAAGHLTYRELNERANQVAISLRSRGFAANQLAGVAMENSVQVIVAILGILKAGGAYVPLDPHYPADRLRLLLADSGASLVLTTQQTVAQLPTTDGCTFLCMEEIPRDLPTANLALINTSDDLAYAIYTSGSTGRPKGTLLRHVGVLNLAAYKRAEHGYSEQDVVLQFVSYSFDASVQEIFPALLNGAQLHILTTAERQSYEAYADAVARVGATVSATVPVFFKQLVTYLPAADLPKLRTLRKVFIGGEALSVELVRQFHRRFRPALGLELVNCYGPTEATVLATTQVVSDAFDNATSVPIGRPIHNVEVYLLNQRGQLCPAGVVGEICIGGAGLANGYLHLAEKTAEVFIPHPFSTVAGARLYRTGDLGRLRADGTLEILGRLDSQVKVRGYRIELGEIEETLLRHPAVEMAAVLAQPDSDGNTVLHGYCTLRDSAETAAVTAAEIKGYLAAQLPPHLVPSALHLLDHLPLSPNGKIDRKQLAQLKVPVQQVERSEGADAGHADGAGIASSSTRKRADVERAILAIWREVLQREEVGVHDNFFDSGGHSILLVKVHDQLKKRLQVEIALTDLFKYPTVRDLTDVLAPAERTESAAEAYQRRHRDDQEAVAIIGIGLRYPGAKNTDEFWENLRNGVCSLTEFPLEELEPTPFNQDPEVQRELVRVGGFLDDIDKFLPELFQIPEKEARLMDPQHRLFLLCAWEAIENAGYNVDELADAPVSVYGGVGTASYLPQGVIPKNISRADLFQAALSNLPKFLTTRVSYKLNLAGESMLVDTACSTSLVAVHMACQSLLNGDSEMALAGGVTVHMPQKKGYLYEPGFINSPDGLCRAFDIGANGTATGSGVGVVLLKRLSDAQRDGDPIYAVIKGSAINNDGNRKIGFTAPSHQGQVKVIAKAQQAAGVPAESITYIEAHGTGTPLGDPIEVAALKEVFVAQTDKQHYCALGSLKTNIGHTDAAAGIGGLIKTALALQHGEIPPSLHYREPNPECQLEGSPFFVNTELRQWDNSAGPRRAGVSSFGIGGTNAHVILEEAPEERD